MREAELGTAGEALSLGAGEEDVSEGDGEVSVG
jgi:hypothetical protein